MKTKKNELIHLVADIGGTNIRLAIAQKGNKLIEIETYKCEAFRSLTEVIALYLKEKKITSTIIDACLAIACPVDNDQISMTNLPWTFSQRALQKELNLNSLTFINDYTAIAMAIPFLAKDQKIKIGEGEPEDKKPIAVCGPGTGLGVAHLVSVHNQWFCFSGEGGHVDFAAVDELDIQILKQLQQNKSRISYEQLLSGYGLEQIYQAICEINGKKAMSFQAKDISNQALKHSCPICQQALSQFCKVLGSFAGNLALTLNTAGGVYISGGIVPRFIDFLKTSDFRKRFEAKGRLSKITQNTPTYVITESQPGLLGAAAYLMNL